jgi:SAM-dependent methyltransferase
VLDRSLTPDSAPGDFYGGSYFNAGEKAGASGYGRYERSSSHADTLATLLAGHLPLRETLDVGCARGFFVEALVELGVNAMGCDFSEYAVNTAARGARGRLRWADLSKRLPWDDRAFDVVTCFETLEHLPQELSDHAVAELARVSRGYVVASIPSFGPRPPLPSGWFDGKMRDGAAQQKYVALGADYDGPIPVADLAVDSQGNPLEGHITIASFRRWRGVFGRAGLVRCAAVEEQLYEACREFNLAGFFDFYVFAKQGVELRPAADAVLVQRARELLRPRRSRREHG